MRACVCVRGCFSGKLTLGATRVWGTQIYCMPYRAEEVRVEAAAVGAGEKEEEEGMVVVEG